MTEAALLFLVFFLPGVLMPQTGETTDMTGIMAQAIFLAIPQTLLMIHVAGLRSDGFPKAYGIGSLRPRDFLISVPVALALLAVSSLLTRFLPGGLGSGFRWKLDSPWQIPLAAVAGLATGYREEFFFRPYLLRRLNCAGAGTAAAIILSTALFASCHAYEGAGGILMAVLQGVGFSALFLRVPSLHVLAFAHGLYNTAVLAFSLAPRP